MDTPASVPSRPFRPVLRAVVPTAAGALRMLYRTFLPANILGGDVGLYRHDIGRLVGQGATSPSAQLTRLSLLALALAPATVARLMSNVWSGPRAGTAAQEPRPAPRGRH